MVARQERVAAGWRWSLRSAPLEKRKECDCVRVSSWKTIFGVQREAHTGRNENPVGEVGGSLLLDLCLSWTPGREKEEEPLLSWVENNMM